MGFKKGTCFAGAFNAGEPPALPDGIDGGSSYDSLYLTITAIVLRTTAVDAKLPGETLTTTLTKLL